MEAVPKETAPISLLNAPKPIVSHALSLPEANNLIPVGKPVKLANSLEITPNSSPGCLSGKSILSGTPKIHPFKDLSLSHCLFLKLIG